jgi:tripartite-type tricarboxylate transporter receptor subunit TctC
VRKWIATVIGLALLVGGTAQGQTSKDVYPNRPVRMIVPFGAGGPGDIFARLIGQKLSEQLGQQFVIENRPGAGGNIGAGVAARAPADGYTLLVGSSTLWVNASLYPQIPYDPVRDFEPIIIGATSPEVLVVHPSVPAKTVQELVALVRAGKYNNFAIAGAGTPPHLSTELFRLSLKLDIVTVPFGGGGPMVQSVVGGHTPVAFATLPSASAQIKDGLLRACSDQHKAYRDPSRRAGDGRSRCARPGARGTAMRLVTRRYATRDRRSFVPRDRACGCFAGPQGENGGDRI